MSANTETTLGPPKGYVECPKKCGRWTNVAGECWTCRGKAEWNAYSSCPDWTPPIAAPVAHIERRKGQRWKSVRRYRYGELIVTGTLGDRMRDDDGWSLVDVERSDGIGAFSSCFTDCCWTRADDVMTLLADAPPEPLTAKDVFGEIPPGSKLTNDTPVKFASAPPVQEAPKAAALPFSFTDKEGRVHRFATGGERDTASRASLRKEPKAAPVCGNNGCKTPTQNVAQRWCIGIDDEGHRSWVELETSCEPCHLLDEAEFAARTMSTAQAGTPYAGPERLPRPQLAADWVEDCLGDVR